MNLPVKHIDHLSAPQKFRFVDQEISLWGQAVLMNYNTDQLIISEVGLMRKGPFGKTGAGVVVSMNACCGQQCS